MSATHTPLAQERDTVPARPALLLTAAFIGMIVVAALASFVILRLSGGSSAPHPERAPREIAGIDLTPTTDTSTQRELAEGKRQLETFGWVDRKRGVVRVPIERAMRDLARAEGE